MKTTQRFSAPVFWVTFVMSGATFSWADWPIAGAESAEIVGGPGIQQTMMDAMAVSLDEPAVGDETDHRIINKVSAHTDLGRNTPAGRRLRAARPLAKGAVSDR